MGDQLWQGASEQVGEWDGLSLVIDTDSYAGNFERDLLKACMGVAAMYEDEDASVGEVYEDLVGSILYDPGDDGFDRVRVCIYRSPSSDEYNSVRIPLSEMPTPDQLADIKTRALAFAAISDPDEYRTPFTITGFRFIRERITAQSVPA